MSITVTVPGNVQAWVPGPLIWPGQSVQVSATGVIQWASGPGLYSTAQGDYDTANPTPAYDPPGCAYTNPPDDRWVAPIVSALDTSYPALSTWPLSLAMLAWPDGSVPSIPAPIPCYRPINGYSLSEPLSQPYSYADLLAVSQLPTSYEGPLRVFFIANGETGDFAGYSGSFDLTLTISGESTMSVPYGSLIRPQIVPETGNVYGAGGAPSWMWNNIEDGGFDQSPEQTEKSYGIQGLSARTGRSLETQSSKGTIKGHLDYLDSPRWFQSFFGAASIAMLTTGVYQHSYLWNAFGAPTPITYAIEAADGSGNGVSNKFYGVCIPGMKIETEEAKSTTCSASWWGQMVQSPCTPTAGANASATLTLNGSPSGGTFMLEDPDGNLTATIAYDAIASAVQTAIRTLGYPGFSAATVSGSAGGPWTYTLANGLPTPLLIPVYIVGGVNTLTGGTSPTLTIAEVSNGGMNIHPDAMVQVNDFSVSFASSLAGLVNAPQVPNTSFMCSIDFGEWFKPGYRQNQTTTSPNFPVFQKPDQINTTLMWTMAYDSSVASLITAAQTIGNDYVYVRMQFLSPVQIATSGYYYSITIDTCTELKWTAIKDSEDNITSVEFTCDAKIDQNLFRQRVICVTSVADYHAL